MISGSLGARRRIRTIHRRIAIGVFVMVVGLFVIATHDVFSHFSGVSNIVDENPENGPATVAVPKSNYRVFGDPPRPQTDAITEVKAKPKEPALPRFKP